MRRLLFAFAALIAVFGCARPAAAQVTCLLPYNLLNGVVYDATQVMADLNALQGCFGGVSPGGMCSATLPGLVPATGGGTANFLRADCTFAPISVASCSNLPAGGCPLDIAMFIPGTPAASAIVNVAITRNVTCPAALAGSVAYAGESSSGTAVVDINQIVGGTPTTQGTVTFTLSSTGVFASSSGMTLSAGNLVQFAFPLTPDSTLGDVAITLACQRT